MRKFRINIEFNRFNWFYKENISLKNRLEAKGIASFTSWKILLKYRELFKKKWKFIWIQSCLYAKFTLNIARKLIYRISCRFWRTLFRWYDIMTCFDDTRTRTYAISFKYFMHVRFPLNSLDYDTILFIRIILIIIIFYMFRWILVE